MSLSSTWSKDRVLADAGIAPLAAVTSYSGDSGGTAPMEVNMIKGKGKWKGKQQSDKGKAKGKFGFEKGKTKSSLTKEKANPATRVLETVTKVLRKVSLEPSWVPMFALTVGNRGIGRRIV